MVNKKIVVICSVIALIIVGGIAWFQIKDFNDSENKRSEVSDNQTVQNIATTNTNTENTLENTQEETNSNENVQNSTKGEEESVANNTQNATNNNQKDGEINTEENNDDTAINLVKKEWGEDNTVYYSIDKHSGNIYNISVRSKSDTTQLAEYEVNLTDKTVIIK